MVIDESVSQSGFLGGRTLREVKRMDKLELLQVNGTYKEIADRMEYFQKLIFPFDDKPVSEPFNKPVMDGTYSILNSDFTNGPQDCPYIDCDFLGMRDVLVTDNQTGCQIVINDVTIHLASEHNLLEKGNRYEVRVCEFYEHFMNT